MAKSADSYKVVSREEVVEAIRNSLDKLTDQSIAEIYNHYVVGMWKPSIREVLGGFVENQK